MKDPKSIPVSADVLAKYKVLKSDRSWVVKSVADGIAKSSMNWTNYKSKSGEVYSGLLAEVEARFAERFPTYPQEVEEHTVKGRSVEGFTSGAFGAWLLALMVSFVLMFVGFPWLFFGTVFFGGWALMGSISAADKFSVEDAKPSELIQMRAAWVREISELIYSEVNIQAGQKFYESNATDPKVLYKSVNFAWVPLGPRPIADKETLTPQGAEIYVAAYMTFYGATGVETTRFSRDGGIDVESDLFAAQVKHQESKVGVKAVRELFAVSSVIGKQAMFFTKIGYSKEAVEFANSVKMPLFVYLPHLQEANFYARKFLESGMGADRN
jgi:hypothetical protein